MKRSEINRVICDAESLFAAQRFHLPPFARWSPEDWASVGPEAAEIVNHGLGWDVTDFGRGDFSRCGIVLFTIRNGSPESVRSKQGKTYCEKLAVIADGQICPAHHHFVKVEDIISRGGGKLAIELHNAGDDGAFLDSDVVVSQDGVRRELPAGTVVTLDHGESLTLEPSHYHRIWSVGGAAMFGEVSVVNDDVNDNRFHEPVGRFPQIDEDEPAYRLLVADYATRVPALGLAPAHWPRHAAMPAAPPMGESEGERE